MKLVKTQLQSRISNSNLAKLIRIAIEGPELSAIDLKKIPDIFKVFSYNVNCSTTRGRIKGAARSINAILLPTVLYFPCSGNY